MKNFLKFISIFIILILHFNINNSNAFQWSDLITTWWDKVDYCEESNDCGIDNWISQVGNNVNWIVTNRNASSYIQDVVKYLIWFIYLIWVILIIYSWFNILISAWDEEKVNKSKKIIYFTIFWILIIFLANTIVWFVMDILNQSSN